MGPPDPGGVVRRKGLGVGRIPCVDCQRKSKMIIGVVGLLVEQVDHPVISEGAREQCHSLTLCYAITAFTLETDRIHDRC